MPTEWDKIVRPPEGYALPALSGLRDTVEGQVTAAYDPADYAELIKLVEEQKVVLWARLYLASPRGSVWLRLLGTWTYYLRRFELTDSGEGEAPHMTITMEANRGQAT